MRQLNLRSGHPRAQRRGRIAAAIGAGLHSSAAPEQAAGQQQQQSPHPRADRKEKPYCPGFVNVRTKPQTDLETLRQELQALTNRLWLAEYGFHPSRKWRFDLACPTLKLAIEQDGGIWLAHSGHTRPRARLRDMQKQNAAQQLGWQVYRYTPQQIQSGQALADITELQKGQTQ